MINIFYNSKELKDTLVVSIASTKATKVVNDDKFTLLYDDDKLIGINIFNFSQYKKLNDGMAYATDDLIKTIKDITKIDLTEYNEKNFLVGQITNLEKIENTHLSYCDVNIGDKTLKIICGAGNVKVDAKVVVAMIGTFLPNAKLQILKSSIQQKESFGMLCSKKELTIQTQKEESGIIILDDHYKVGELFIEPFSNK